LRCARFSDLKSRTASTSSQLSVVSSDVEISSIRIDRLPDGKKRLVPPKS